MVLRAILAERHFPVESMRYLASARSAGPTLPWGDGEIVVEDAETADLSGIDLALCSAPASVSRALAPRLAAAGAIVIDNSSAWRMDPEVPLVVPEANAAELRSIPKGIVANPNCTTMVAIPVLKPLDDEAGLTRLVVSTYQAVSGGGVEAVREWRSSCRRRSTGRSDLTFDGSSVDFPPRSVYPVPIAHNVDSAPVQDRRRRLARDRRGAEVLQRGPQDPRAPRPRRHDHLRARAGLHRALGRHRVRVRAAHHPRARHRGAPDGAGRRAGRDPDAARWRPAAMCPMSAASGGPRVRPTHWPSSSRATTCARARRSTWCRSPRSCWRCAPERSALGGGRRVSRGRRDRLGPADHQGGMRRARLTAWSPKRS